MAERRMFAKTIIDNDVFLDMPLSAQALYFHLAMRADDDGFVGNPKKIQKMIGASDDDCKLLIMKRYILTFDSGIIVIKHWKIHNYIQTDRYKPTTYLEEKSSLKLDEKKSYVECIQDVSKMYPQVSIGKDSIDISKKESNKENINYLDNTHACESYDEILDAFEVSQEVRNKLFEFIKHCQLNGKTLTNDKLKNIIIRLDFYCNSDLEKVHSLGRAISGGYFDILEGKVQ